MMLPFEISETTRAYQARLLSFMDDYIYPSESVYADQLTQSRWSIPPIMEELKIRAKETGLWNLFLPDSEYGAGLTNTEYAPLAEIMGRSPIASEAFNCSAPDTGNMEVLVRYGSPEQKDRWLKPLLDGRIRSCFAMTEPDVASSDASNIRTRIVQDGDYWVITGRKWWSSGAGDPRSQVAIVMGVTDPQAPKYERQSMVLVPLNAPGVTVQRMVPVFGYDDAPHGHGEILFDQVRVPLDHIIWGAGKGFAIAQGRLGPGRIHHAMRQIGAAERALELMARRSVSRETFGRLLADHGVVRDWIARSRIQIDQARLLTLWTAYKMDMAGNKAARREIAMIKIVAPNMALDVLDRAIQLFGGAGVSDDWPLARLWTNARTLRIADGPDEVHLDQLARDEIRPYRRTLAENG